MAAIAKLTPGQVVYDLARDRMGNTMVKTTRVHTVRILEVNQDHVIASWNGNPQKRFTSGTVSKWKVKKPVMVEGFVGSRRLATKDEIAEAKENGKLQESSAYFLIRASR